jgi:hypothetical protein
MAAVIGSPQRKSRVFALWVALTQRGGSVLYWLLVKLYMGLTIFARRWRPLQFKEPKISRSKQDRQAAGSGETNNFPIPVSQICRMRVPSKLLAASAPSHLIPCRLFFSASMSSAFP